METKAKRRLSEFDFSKTGCHISLVGPEVGGSANGYQTLVIKSLNPQTGQTKPVERENMNEEMIQKSAVAVMIEKAVGEATMALKAELEAMKVEKAANIEKIRKQALIDIVGEAQAELDFPEIKDVGDKAYETILKGFASAKSAESKSPMFKQVGVEAKADAEKLQENDGVMYLLKQKYQSTNN